MLICEPLIANKLKTILWVNIIFKIDNKWFVMWNSEKKKQIFRVRRVTNWLFDACRRYSRTSIWFDLIGWYRWRVSVSWWCSSCGREGNEAWYNGTASVSTRKGRRVRCRYSYFGLDLKQFAWPYRGFDEYSIVL